MAYDEEFRREALSYWSAGYSRAKVAELFGISTKTLHVWKSHMEARGTPMPVEKPTWCKIDPVKFRKYVEEHPDAYLRDIAAEFGCTVHAVEQALARENLSLKKRWFANDEEYRRHAIDYWNEVRSSRKTAEKFKVSESTLDRWKAQFKEADSNKHRK